jgi:hypothetical protein
MVTVSSALKNVNIAEEKFVSYNLDIILGTQNDASYKCRRVLIESIDGGTDVFLTEGILKKTIQIINQHPLPPLNRSTIENQLQFEGWKHEQNP